MTPSLAFTAAPDTPANGNMAEHICRGDLQHIEETIAGHFSSILEALRIDQNDPNAHDTPRRYAKMLVREVCRGRFEEPPVLTIFPNTKKMDELVATGPIEIRSLCSHHFCPIIGRAWIGVIYGERVMGLSKFNRVVDWFASRPQIQEELVVQIADYLEHNLMPKALGIVIEASHTCLTWRGARAHPDASMATNVMRGAFRDAPEARAEFLGFVSRHR